MSDEKVECDICNGTGEQIAVIGGGEPNENNTIIMYCRCPIGMKLADEQFNIIEEYF